MTKPATDEPRGRSGLLRSAFGANYRLGIEACWNHVEVICGMAIEAEKADPPAEVADYLRMHRESDQKKLDLIEKQAERVAELERNVAWRDGSVAHWTIQVNALKQRLADAEALIVRALNAGAAQLALLHDDMEAYLAERGANKTPGAKEAQQP